MIVEDCPEASRATANTVDAAPPSAPLQQLVPLRKLLDVRAAAGLPEHRGGEDEDRRVHEEREAQRHERVQGVEADRLRESLRRLLVLAGLHEAGVEIQVVRHHRRADDPEGDDQRAHARQAGNERSARDGSPIGPREQNLEQEAAEHGAHQGEDDRLDLSEAEAGEPQQHEHVEPGDEHAELQRQVEQQVQGDGRADDLGEVAGDDRDLAEKPEGDRGGLPVVVAAGHREVLARREAQPGAEHLEELGNEARQQHHPEQGVAVPRAAAEVGSPVAGVHVADADEVSRSHEREEPPKPSRALGHGNAPERLGERTRGGGPIGRRRRGSSVEGMDIGGFRPPTVLYVASG